MGVWFWKKCSIMLHKSSTFICFAQFYTSDSSWLELYGSLSTMHIRKKSFFSTHLPLLLFLQLLDFICIDMLFMIECTSLLEEYFLPRRHVFFGSFYIIVNYLSKVLVSTRAMSGSFEGSLWIMRIIKH